jgi:SNF2 family DNA or RNA helicase
LSAVTHPTPAPSVGSLVHVRGRDWVVLPSTDPDVLRLRPLTGTEQDVTGIFLPLEGRFVRPAHFLPPDPAKAGDATGGLLLRDAARLAIRNGAAPFRSLGRIAVTPRPYQFVPLLMALRLDSVRMLIADDVGVGKTIEAAMIARELLDRGVARRLVVLCPPHLCEQWQAELREKFAIDAAVIQPATMGRLERNLPRPDLGVYQYYRHLIISIDYAKTERNRGTFLNNVPDLVIVDEAHTAARPPSHGAATQHQRYELLRRLAEDASRNLILVTATPHSGIEESF